MPSVIPDEGVRRCALSEPERVARPWTAGLQPDPPPSEVIGPNALVRWAFYLSVVSIPFARLYIPGTGERSGVIRIAQVLLLCAVVSQPRLCLRLVPVAFLWFVADCAGRGLV